MLKRLSERLWRPSARRVSAPKQAWARLVRGGGDAAGRRDAFRWLIWGLLAEVPGFFVASAHGPWVPEEVSLLIRNESRDPVVRGLGPILAVGLKAHRTRPTQATDVAVFLGAVASNKWNAGLLFSLSGFTANALQRAGMASRNGPLIGLVGPEEVQDMMKRPGDVGPLVYVLARTLLVGRGLEVSAPGSRCATPG